MKAPIFFLLLFIVSVAHSQTTNVFPASGFTGIGTLSPVSLLHLKADDPDLTLDINSASTVANSPELRFSLDGIQKAAVFWSKLDEKLYMRNNGHIVLIDKNGFVGIGTSNPNAKLEVSGTVNTAAIVLSNENLIGFRRADGALVYGIGHTAGEFTIGASTNLGPAAGTPVHIAAGSSSTPIKFSQSSFERMRIANNGNIGIGTASPDAKLTVKGVIHTEEVKVDLNVPGPDYVFEEDYDLPSLEDLQNYIRENKHLPEVPSAREMEANGIDLGTMNLLLLKKVEELTLHLIEQNGEIQSMKELLQLQQYEMDSLKKYKER